MAATITRRLNALEIAAGLAFIRAAVLWFTQAAQHDIRVFMFDLLEEVRHEPATHLGPDGACLFPSLRRQ